MSSLEKAFKSSQRLHRERVNTNRRGFLERKKDYKVRAAEYNKRAKTLKSLKQKVLDKNPDEFYFHMKNSRVVDGVHFELRKDDDEHTPEELKVIQSQDLNYVNYKRSIDLKKIEKMKQQYHMIDVEGKPANQHIFFVEDSKDAKKVKIADKMKMDSKLLKMGFNFANPAALKNVSIEDVKDSHRTKDLKYRQLENKVQREELLKNVGEKMQIKVNICKHLFIHV